MQIQDSTVLVTGANRGIGKAFADALLDRGATRGYAERICHGGAR